MLESGLIGSLSGHYQGKEEVEKDRLALPLAFAEISFCTFILFTLMNIIFWYMLFYIII